MGESLPRVPGGAQQHPSNTVNRRVQTLRVKMVLLGSSGVGKSSLALRFGKDQFRSSSPTVGFPGESNDRLTTVKLEGALCWNRLISHRYCCDYVIWCETCCEWRAAQGCAYLTKVVHLSDVTLRFEIWDTAGQEKYHSVTPLYYRGAHVALLVYDISKRETFIRAQVWLKELEKHYIPGSTVIWLVGNKGDLAEKRQVSAQEAQNLANERGLSFSETSALSGDQVNELLLAVAHRVYECIGAQQGGLSEWRETSLVTLQQRDTSNPVASCCKVGP